MFDTELILIENVAGNAMERGNISILTKTMIVASEIQGAETSYSNRQKALNDLLDDLKKFRDDWQSGKKEMAMDHLNGTLKRMEIDLAAWKEKQ